MGEESHLDYDLCAWPDESRAGFEADCIVVVVAPTEDRRHGDVEVRALYAGRVSSRVSRSSHVKRLARRAELELSECSICFSIPRLKFLNPKL